MDEEKSIEKNPIGVWRHLISEQTELFSKTVLENESLVIRNRELEREVMVWKQALAKADGDQETVQKNANILGQQVYELQQQIRSLHEDHPIILVIIDGDGNIFADELLRQGRVGGRNAATLLTKGITENITYINGRVASRARLWVTVYCNKQGLSETLCNNNICTAEDFEGFCIGFNQATPLFSIIDVGPGKEAADAKIKEYLRVFSLLPQMALIYFGGGHDNGYSSTLASLETEGLLDKVILLHGYKELALELQHLRLPAVHIDGLFRPTKVPSHTTKFKNYKTSPENHQEAEDAGRKRKMKPGVPMNKQNPVPCTFFYLGTCNKGAKCAYSHDYELTPENYEEMRRLAKRFPCAMINKGKTCPLGDDCFSSHNCPHGKNCSWLKQGKCRFLGKDMHNKKSSHHEHQRSSSKSSASSSSQVPLMFQFMGEASPSHSIDSSQAEQAINY
ncbi:hypothetical protein BDZ89DRAFT_1058812 [Hymenopellis radicata]|nr:hypothetical protein BDZ89DRAFT_1058812 [Hymenopellis radicata]